MKYLVGENFLERCLDENVLVDGNCFKGRLRATEEPRIFYIERNPSFLYVIANGDNLATLIDGREFIARPY